MTKADLLKIIATQAGITQAQADKALTAITETITTELTQGREFQLHGVGKFKPVHKAERIARNPKTGEPANVPAHTTVKFLVSKTMTDTLN